MAVETANPCPHCGRWHMPTPAVDVVVYEESRGVLLVQRRYAPFGWALPGGFVEYGECVETAAVREILEETGLRVVLTGLLGVYSDPGRDARRHTISTVFTAEAGEYNTLQAGDDAADAVFFPLDALPLPLAFDHERILADFARVRGIGIPTA